MQRPLFEPWRVREMKPILLAVAACAAVAQAGCNNVTCASGTLQKVNAKTGDVECVPSQTPGGVQCGANAMLVGGVCVGIDPSSACGKGTTYDPTTKTCVGGGM